MNADAILLVFIAAIDLAIILQLRARRRGRERSESMMRHLREAVQRQIDEEELATAGL